MTSPFTRVALILLGLALFSGKVFYDLYGGVTNPLQLHISNDLFSYWWPMLSFASDSVNAGSLPLWNPYTSIGNSVIGELGAGLFHPTTWTIFVISDTPTAMLINQLSTIVISMAGAYAYARYLELSWPAMFLCVALFGYCAFTESFAYSSSASICWFPTILYLTHRCFDRPNTANACWLALALAMSFFGGFANYFLYTCMIVGAYFSTLLVLSWRSYSVADATKRLGLMVLAVILLSGFIAIQLLPAYELSSLAVRNVHSTTAFDPNSGWEKASVSLLFLNFLLPNHNFLFGIETLKMDTGLFYLGGTLVLLPLAFINPRFRMTAIALTAGCVLMLLIILSTQLSVLSFIQDLPLVGALRIHSRGMVYIELLMIIMACMGLSTIGDTWASGKTIVKPLVKALSILVPVAFALVVSAIAVVAVQNILSIIGLLLCAGILVTYYVAPARASRLKQLGWIIAAIIVIDVSVHRENRFLVPAFSNTDDTFEQQSAQDYRAREDHYRLLLAPQGVEDIYTFANLGLPLRIPNISSYDSLTLSRWSNFIREMIGPARFDRLAAASANKWFYGDFSPQMLKHLLSDGRFLGLASLRYVYTRDNVSINEHALPRAYVVHNYITTNTEQQSLEAVKANIGTLHETVILENASPVFSPMQLTESQKTSDESVLIKNYTPNDIQLSVDVSLPAILVLTDTFYPGWEAYIDGNETEIFRANSMFRAIEVPPGQHSVEFRYRPTSLYLGASITLLTICLVVLFTLASRRRRLSALRKTSLDQIS